MQLNKISGIALIFFFAMFTLDLSAHFAVSPCDDPDNVTDFINPPADITLTCEELATTIPETLSYFNNQSGACEISGSVSATVTGAQNSCGGLVTYNWEFTDECGRFISHTQVVTVEPVSIAAFVNPPAEGSINCDEIETFSSAALIYTNGSNGACLIEGTAEAVADGTFDICGSSVIYTWEFTDECGRLISHAQKVTVEPILEAAFIDPPADISISCNEIATFAPSTLTYTNGSNEPCLIEGAVEAVADGTFDICGSSIIYTWEFEDDCSLTILHSQTVNLSPVPEASFLNPPGPITITCEEWSTFIPATLGYSNNQDGACEISGSISAVSNDPLEPCGNDIIYSWEITDLCGRVITYNQVVTVETVLATNSITKDNIKVYPNPTSHMLNIKSDYQITSLNLYTTTGNSLHRSQGIKANNMEIDLSTYPLGLYLLHVETEKGGWIEKVVKR